MQPKFKLLQTIGYFGKGEISMEQMVDAVDAYTSALLKQCNVSGRSEQLIFDCPEPQWHNGDIQRYGQCTFCNNKAFIKN